MIGARTRLYGLIGHPVRHSLSPAMYNELFQRYGQDAVYLAFDVDPDRAERVAEAVRTLDLAGVNLTVPFKERVLPELDRLTVAAEEAGAVNVLIQKGGQLMGFNTDGEGLVRHLEQHGVPIEGRRALILGAGGTGRAVASALLDREAAGVVLLNRTLSRAEAAVAALSRRFGHVPLEAAPLTAAAFAEFAPQAELVVHCTAAGGAERVSALDPSTLPRTATWVDVNYWMPDPPQQAACAALGLRFHTGLGMLVHQAALAFELFTGNPVEAEDLERILKHEQASR